MSEFIKLTSPRGAALVRREDVRSVDHSGTTATVYMAAGFLRDVTDPLPTIEAALGYREHPAVADLARYKLHLDDILNDVADAGFAVPPPGADPELVPRQMVKALIAEVVALRGRVASAEAAAPAFVPAKVGDRWGDLTEAQIKALPEGTTIVVGALSKTLRGGEWFYDIGGQWAASNTPRGPSPDNRITHIPAPAAAPTPKPGDVVTVEMARALPVGAVVEWTHGGQAWTAKQVEPNVWSRSIGITERGWQWVSPDLDVRLVSLPTPSPTLPTPGALLHTLTDDDLDRLPEGSRFVADDVEWFPLIKRDKEWRVFGDSADIDHRRSVSRERANYRLHLPSGAE